MANVPISTKSVGSIVTMRVDGYPENFIVINQGKPSSLYDESCNGTWLMMESIIGWNNVVSWSKGGCNYANSTIHTYLNNTFLNSFESNIKNTIKQVKIPYRNGDSGKTISSGANGLSTKIFLLSGYEVGWTTSDVYPNSPHSLQGLPIDGVRLPYFYAGTGGTANNRRIAKAGGVDYFWWLRSPFSTPDYAGYIWYVSDGGTSGIVAPSATSPAFRPILVLPPTTLVSEYGEVTTNTAPTAPTAFTLPGSIRGGVAFAISWSGARDAQNNLQGYYLERSINGGSTWSRIYQGSAAATTDTLSFGITTNVMYRVKAYDIEGLESGWYISSNLAVVNNKAPGAPASITVPLTVLGGQPVTVTWSAAVDNDGNLAGYKLERNINAGTTWTQVYQGPALSFSDNVTKGWTSLQYRVKAFDSYAEESGYTTSAVRSVDNNTAPTISCSSSGNLGIKADGFSVSYSVNDVDADVVTVVEKMDGIQKRSFQATLLASNSFQVTGDYFMRLLNGQHTMTITATDTRGKSATLTLTFTKAVYSCSISLAAPMGTDALVTKMVMNIVRNIPAGANFKVLVCNNAFDATPTWEDATQSVRSGLNFLFTNTTITAKDAKNNPKYGYNFVITASRQEISPGVYGSGGFIASIGGALG